MTAPRNVGDVLRRGLDNTLANWPLLLIRIGENVLFVMIVVGGVLATLIPVISFIAAGSVLRDLPATIGAAKRGQLDEARAAEIANALREFLFSHWWLIAYVLVAITVMLLVLIAVHSFVVAGMARVFVDGDRAAGDGALRNGYAAFDVDRWMAGGRAKWWSVFWIYNGVYAALSLFILLPLIATLALMLLLNESPAAIVVGCLGLVVSLFLMLILSVVASLWSQKSIVAAVARGLDTSTALRVGWHEAMQDPGRHFAVVLILLAITFGGTGAIASVSFMVSAPSAVLPPLMLLFLPIRLALSVISGVWSAAVGNWLLACFAALEK